MTTLGWIFICWAALSLVFYGGFRFGMTVERGNEEHLRRATSGERSQP